MNLVALTLGQFLTSLVIVCTAGLVWYVAGIPLAYSLTQAYDAWRTRRRRARLARRPRHARRV